MASALAAVVLPVITAPAAESTVPSGPVVTKIGDYPVRYDAYGKGLVEAAHGSATTMTVDYSSAAPGAYTITWGCGIGPRDQEVSSQIPEDAPEGTVVFPIDTTEPSYFCSFLVQGPGTEYFVRLLQLDPLQVSEFKNPTGPYVYPRITPDEWRARFETNSPAAITTSVRNKAGRVVFSRDSETRRIDRGDSSRAWGASVAWNGRRTNGTLVPLGTYRIRIAVQSTRGSGRKVIGPLPVTVKPGRRPITIRVWQTGRQGSSLARGGCFAVDQPTGAVWLNCAMATAGSTSVARATWTFRVPRSAKLIDWTVKGGTGGDDRPGIGSIRKTITRPEPTLFRMRVTVTGRRSYLVQNVSIKYTYLK